LPSFAQKFALSSHMLRDALGGVIMTNVSKFNALVLAEKAVFVDRI